MRIKVYIDGSFYSKEDAKISVFDHGFLYGDGVFEGIRVYNSSIFKFKEHLDRLYESAHTLLIDVPLSKEEMQSAVIETLKINSITDGYIRLIVSRGIGDLGLSPEKCPKASVVIIADNIVLYPDEYYREGLAIITVPTVRNHLNALNPAVKSLNYLNNIMAKIEATNCGYKEAIMLNSDGTVAECTGDNVFMLKNGLLSTPPQYTGSLKGITRNTIIELAGKMGIRFSENIITRHDLYNADEVFLTGTAAEIIPVIKIDGRVIGTGVSGELTLKFIEEFRKIVEKDGFKY